MSALTLSTVREAPAGSPSNQLYRFLRTPKGSLLAVFTPLLATAGTVAGWPLVLPHLAAAVFGACLVDLVAIRLSRGAWRWPSSALLSGLIVAFILGPETPTIVTLAVGALASMSKHLFTIRRSHVFNPAALALLISIPLFGTGQSWWGALADLPWPALIVLLAGGGFIVDRIDKFPLVLSFLGTYFGLFTIVGLAAPLQVAEMFRAPFIQASLFFTCFMLTDPPTAPARHADQVAIGGLVGAVSCVAHLLGAGQSYLLAGILAGNLGLVGWRWADRTLCFDL